MFLSSQGEKGRRGIDGIDGMKVSLALRGTACREGCLCTLVTIETPVGREALFDSRVFWAPHALRGGAGVLAQSDRGLGAGTGIDLGTCSKAIQLLGWEQPRKGER